MMKIPDLIALSKDIRKILLFSPFTKAVKAPLATISLSMAFCGLSMAQVIAVPFQGRDSSTSSASTLTYVWQAGFAQATLIFVPGGEGRLALSPERKSIGGFYGGVLRPLASSSLTSGHLNVVVFDSPTPLDVGTDYPYSRKSAEHLQRLESVIRFFSDRYGLPIWIMGHSNGAASITELYKALKQEGRESLISGAIYSSARHGASFGGKLDIPVLILAHERDSCPRSTPAHSRGEHDKLLQAGSGKTKLVLLKTGEAQFQKPCVSGFHMFEGAYQEAYNAIDNFFNSAKQ